VGKTASVAEIRSALVAAQAAILQGETLEVDGVDESALDKVLVCIIQKSYLKKEATDKKHDARLLGQMNEPEMLKKLWDLSQTDWQLPVTLRAIYHPGLVRQKERAFVKASADACVVYRTSNRDDDGSHDSSEERDQFMPLEIKTLVKGTKIDGFKERLLARVGFNTCKENESVLWSVDASDANDWLQNDNWLLQALHQAVTFDADSPMFLVGSERRLLLGLIISYPLLLKESLCLIMDWIHASWLHKFCCY